MCSEPLVKGRPTDADSRNMVRPVDRAIQIEREQLFARISAAFAVRDFAAVVEGMRPDVELTLRGSSWLAGKYVGYDEFFQYVAGAAQVLGSTDGQLSYIHAGEEMTVVHEFRVGPTAVEMALHEVFTFDEESMITALLIRPWDQAKFDLAVNAFLASRTFDPLSSRAARR
jgi:ketosteroid isomerase-like protein